MPTTRRRAGTNTHTCKTSRRKGGKDDEKKAKHSNNHHYNHKSDDNKQNLSIETGYSSSTRSSGSFPSKSCISNKKLEASSSAAVAAMPAPSTSASTTTKIFDEFSSEFDQSLEQLLESIDWQSSAQYSGDELRSLLKVFKLSLMKALRSNSSLKQVDSKVTDEPSSTSTLKQPEESSNSKTDSPEPSIDTDGDNTEEEEEKKKDSKVKSNARKEDSEVDDDEEGGLEDLDLDQFALEHLDDDNEKDQVKSSRKDSSETSQNNLKIDADNCDEKKEVDEEEEEAEKEQEVEEEEEEEDLFKQIKIPDISKELEKLKEQEEKNQNVSDSGEEMEEIGEDFKNVDLLSSTQLSPPEADAEQDEDHPPDDSELTLVDSQISLNNEDEGDLKLDDMYEINPENLDDIDPIFESDLPDQNYSVDLKMLEGDGEEGPKEDSEEGVSPSTLKHVDDDGYLQVSSESDSEKKIEDSEDDKNQNKDDNMVRMVRRQLNFDSDSNGSNDSKNKDKIKKEEKSKTGSDEEAKLNSDKDMNSPIDATHLLTSDDNDSEDKMLKQPKKKSSTLKKRQLMYLSEDDDDDDGGKKKKDKEETKETIINKQEEDLTTEEDEKKAEKKEEEGDENSNSNSNKRKKSNDEDDESTDEDMVLKKKKAKGSVKKRKRRVVVLNTSDEEQSESEEYECTSPNTSRRSIRKILTDDQLARESKNAAKEEQERRKRIEEKQKLYNKLREKSSQDGSAGLESLVLDFDSKTGDTLVEVDPKMVKCLKHHQVEGIKFMYTSTIESLEELKRNRRNAGCILAHSMGLGKTFQVVAFLHTVLTNEHTRQHLRRALIIVPLNVIQNWVSEFDKWFDDCEIRHRVDIYDMSYEKTISSRTRCLQKWFKSGGILLITITLFSQLVQGKSLKGSRHRKDFEVVKRSLASPGADLVVIDEGHLLKNEKSAFNKAVSTIATRRRIILTGTPLQNNLSEYYTMVQFVKPNLLGSKKEFKNRFENPITYGQHIDSTPSDVKLMKKRVHVLHNLLSKCINRCDYSVLVPYLQPKFEYVLSIALSEVQSKIYQYYLENLAQGRENRKGLLADHSELSLICNHPALLFPKYQDKELEDELEEDADSMKDFIVDSDEDESGSESTSSSRKQTSNTNSNASGSESEIECIFQNINGAPTASKPVKRDPCTRSLRSGKAQTGSERRTYWFESMLPEFEEERSLWTAELSSKFILLVSMLEQCEAMGDKVLIFSQSLRTLTMIERVLAAKMDELDDRLGASDLSYIQIASLNGGVTHRWLRDVDYYRLDGQVNCQTRSSLVNKFNDPSNYRARLMLISTKAGGVGINLVGANRCIIFDVSWNPSTDLQAIYRIFRYGQTKPVYVYRFAAYGTMESQIYRRQIVKQSLSHRIVDEHQIQRHYRSNELQQLYTFTEPEANRPKPVRPKDNLLADMLLKHPDMIVNYHEHDSLLENRPEEHLTEEERQLAWDEYQTERERYTAPPATNLPNMPNNLNMNNNASIQAMSSLLQQQQYQQHASSLLQQQQQQHPSYVSSLLQHPQQASSLLPSNVASLMAQAALGSHSGFHSQLNFNNLISNNMIHEQFNNFGLSQRIQPNIDTNNTHHNYR